MTQTAKEYVEANQHRVGYTDGERIAARAMLALVEWRVSEVGSQQAEKEILAALEIVSVWMDRVKDTPPSPRAECRAWAEKVIAAWPMDTIGNMMMDLVNEVTDRMERDVCTCNSVLAADCEHENNCATYVGRNAGNSDVLDARKHDKCGSLGQSIHVLPCQKPYGHKGDHVMPRRPVDVVLADGREATMQVFPFKEKP
jgi:hypothetical protein